MQPKMFYLMIKCFSNKLSVYGGEIESQEFFLEIFLIIHTNTVGRNTGFTFFFLNLVFEISE